MINQNEPMPQPASGSAERLYALDAMRGFAAIGVAFFWHYVHFCLSCEKSTFPFYSIFHWFYDYGVNLVDFFFVLSGYVFWYVYAEKIANGEVSFRQYFVNRLARLYPLHFVTLIVATIEVMWMASHGHSFIYQNNDVLHFVMSLFLVQSGWFDNLQTFNGPSWSIATEFIVYFIFFAAMIKVRDRMGLNILFCVLIYIGFAQVYTGDSFWILNNFTGRALLGFFVGCIASEIKAHLDRNAKAQRFFRVGFLLFVAVLFVLARKADFQKMFGHYEIVFPLIIYPSLILFVLYSKKLCRVLSMAPFKVLGACSYSLYLWHYPIQTILFSVYMRYGIAAQSALSWCIYFFTVMSVAIISHYSFEKPMRLKVRRLFST